MRFYTGRCSEMESFAFSIRPASVRMEMIFEKDRGVIGDSSSKQFAAVLIHGQAPMINRRVPPVSSKIKHEEVASV